MQKQNPLPWNTHTLKSVTLRSGRALSHLMCRARNAAPNDFFRTVAPELEADARKEERLAEQQCKYCFYRLAIAETTRTARPCACYGRQQRYNTADADALCIECATRHSLCRRCGGDIALDAVRHDWPTPEA